MQFPSGDEQRRTCVRMCAKRSESDKERQPVRNEEEDSRFGNVVCGVPASAVPFSSEAWRMVPVLGRVPLAWCLKMEEESSSRVQPSRYAAFWAHSWRANCFLPAETRAWKPPLALLPITLGTRLHCLLWHNPDLLCVSGQDDVHWNAVTIFRDYTQFAI